MDRSVIPVALVAFASVSLSADVTITQVLSVEGPAAAAAGNVQMPRVVTRIKGMKARTDIEVMGQTFSAIIDVAGRQVTVLQSAAKTAIVAAPASVTGAAPLAAPEMTVTFKPTGQTRTLIGMSCEEQSVALSFELVNPATAVQMPPEAAAFMKGARIVANGSIWFGRSAPGAAEFTAFQKAAAEAALMPALSALSPGPSGGMDRLWAALQSVPGLPCLGEMAMTVEGSGPLVEVSRQKGPVTVIHKTTAVSTDALPDGTFDVPADYKIVKK